MKFDLLGINLIRSRGGAFKNPKTLKISKASFDEKRIELIVN